MQPCQNCGLPTLNAFGFCCEECYEQHRWDEMERRVHASEDCEYDHDD